MFTDPPRSNHRAIALARLDASLSQVDGLSGTAARSAFQLATQGVPVYVMPMANGNKLLYIQLPCAMGAHLWTVKAWNQYVWGHHCQEPLDLCQCADCTRHRAGLPLEAC